MNAIGGWHDPIPGKASDRARKPRVIASSQMVNSGAAQDEPEHICEPFKDDKQVSPVWDALCKSRPDIIAQITGEQVNDPQIPLATVVEAFHAESLAQVVLDPRNPENNRGAMLPGQLVDVLLHERFTGPYCHRRRKQFEAEVRQYWKQAAAYLAAEGKRKQDEAKARGAEFECTLADLQTQVFPPIKWIVPDYIPEGLSVFAGRPKIGKSWWMLGIALAVARGTETLGKFVQQGAVLYCGLEDGKRRMQSRVAKILGHAVKQWPANFTFRERLSALDAGGLETIEAWLIEHATTRRLVVVDTYGKVRGMKGAREEQYQYDYRLVGSLQELATKYNVAIVLVHHVRKSDAEDILDTICGSTGIAGAADTPMVLGKTAQGIRFYLRGRDVEEQDKLVEFDQETGLWSVTGDYDEQDPSGGLQGLRRLIFDLLSGSPVPLTPAQIVARLPNQRGVTVRSMLSRMAKDGQVRKSDRVHGGYEAQKQP